MPLTKMFNLDSQLVLEAYEMDEKSKVEELLNNRNHLLTAVSAAVQELAALMVQLKESSDSVEASAFKNEAYQENSEGQVTSAQELASIVSLIEKVTDELNKLN